MFEYIKKIISGDQSPVPEQDSLSVELALAVLLFDAAFADGRCSKEEKTHLIRTLETTYQVPPHEIDDLLAERDKERKEHVNLFRYTRFLNEQFSEKQKIDLMTSVWRIILLDGELEAYEDHFAHRLADLLNLSHSDLIDAKLLARKQLSKS